MVAESGKVILPEYVLVCHATPDIQRLIADTMFDILNVFVRTKSVYDGGHIGVLLGTKDIASHVFIRSIREVDSLRQWNWHDSSPCFEYDFPCGRSTSIDKKWAAFKLQISALLLVTSLLKESGANDNREVRP